jgi:dolichol-phosphate mannosyltransferase
MDITTSSSPLLSIVVPVYNEEKTVPLFLQSIRSVLETVTEDYEIIFAMDPGTDRTEEIISAAHQADARIKLLRFSRRFGQPAATWAGLRFASGQAVIPIDCDLQDPPELIPEMVRIWREEGFKVVIPQRTSREGENILKKLVAYAGYWFINKTASVSIPRNTGDFRLLDRVVVDALMRLNESHGFLRGLTSLVGFKTRLLPFSRQARAGGEGKYNRITGSLKIGFNGIVAFSDFLLNAISAFGLLMSIGSFLVAMIFVLAKLFGQWNFPVGFTTLVVLMLFLSGMQFLAIGVMGAYISRIYDEVKLRPRFIVERSLGFNPDCQQSQTQSRDREIFLR